MATIEDMAEVVNNVYHNSGEMADRILKRSARRFSSIVMDLLYQALRDAENSGQWHMETYGNSEWCSYWRVGDYLVTYSTDDEFFNTELVPINADMLTDEMMDDLIIDVA